MNEKALLKNLSKEAKTSIAWTNRAITGLDRASIRIHRQGGPKSLLQYIERMQKELIDVQVSLMDMAGDLENVSERIG